MGLCARVIERDPADLRPLIPKLGLREYWYPALPDKKVRRRPVYWVMLGEELVFFRDEHGEVVALTDVCPHRGASLSQKDNAHYKGFITCPYHGATFNGQGQCVAFITEGPDSRMVGELKARRYPTRTLRGWVFVWMGDGEPAPIEEDVPPELFEDESSTVVAITYTYWRTNWMIAIENQNDSHNCFWVHRNSVKQLFGIQSGRQRTPIGPRSKVVNGRGVIALGTNQRYYAKDGKMPYQMYYPGIYGVWPLHRWRLLWTWFFKRVFAKGGPRFEAPEEWSSAHHLPCAIRVNYGPFMYTRYAVPVKANISRQVLFHTARRQTPFGRMMEKARFYVFQNWLQNYNFSRQDNEVASPCRYWTPEHLSATDSHLVLLRKVIVEQSRDALRGRLKDVSAAPGPANGQEWRDGLEHVSETRV
jgi:phenylpropionate dioxygenase-like ring-hydroxylating dioxygenase large terminal subunit